MGKKLSDRHILWPCREGELRGCERCNGFDDRLLIVLPTVFLESDKWRSLLRHVNLFLPFAFGIRVFGISPVFKIPRTSSFPGSQKGKRDYGTARCANSLCTTFRHRHGRGGRLLEIAEVEEETEHGERKKQQVKSMRVSSPARSAIADLKAAGILPASVELRQVKYLNNLIEQDHRFIKRLTKPGMGFFSFKTAWQTLQGFETMNMIRKGQLQGVVKGDVRSQVALVAQLFGVIV
jgi:hypothetical protein